MVAIVRKKQSSSLERYVSAYFLFFQKRNNLASLVPFLKQLLRK